VIQNKTYIYNPLLETFTNFNSKSFKISHKLPFQLLNKHKVFSFTSKYIFEKQIIDINIADEDIKDIIFERIYQSRDNSIKYSFLYDEVQADLEKKRLFYVYIIEEKYLQSEFQISYFPIQILLKSIQNIGDNIYFFIDKEETIVNFYRNSNLIFSKHVDFSLLKFHKEFNSIERISFSDFLKEITCEDLEKKKKGALTKALKIFFMEVVKVIQHIKINFLVQEFNLYFLSSSGKIFGIDEYAKTVFTQNQKELFNQNIKNDIEYLTFLNIPTSSLFFKGQKIQKKMKPVGKLSIVLSISLTIALSYPLSNYFELFTLQKELEEISTSAKKNIDVEKLKLYKSLKQRQDELNFEFQELQSNHENHIETFEKIYQNKKNLQEIVISLYQITEILNQNSVFVDSIQLHKNQFILQVVANKHSKVSKFLMNISQKFSVEYDSIKFNSEKNLFTSTIKIATKL
jgi:hypothetical protein